MTNPLANAVNTRLGNQEPAASRRWPADQIELRDTACLQPFANNPRTHSAEQIDQIVSSIREWGWTIPILVDEADGVIAGHGRLLAARKLGIERVPVLIARDWSEAQKRAYVIADNQLALNADWDADLLRVEIGALKGLDFDLALTGFDLDQIGKLLGLGPEGLSDPDDTPAAPAIPVTQAGDLWLLGNHRLLCGDSTNKADVEHLLAGDLPHLMVTDPPYGVAYDPAWRARAGVNRNKAKLGLVANDDRADWREAWELFSGDVAYVWHGALHATTVHESLIATGFVIRSQIIWAKDRFALSRGHYHWQHEPAFYAVRDKGHWHGDRSQSTIWSIPSRDDNGIGHGTQKPVECMKRPMLNNSAPGDWVYDPFSGSGTTIIAGELSSRRVLAMELMPAYVDMSVIRWQNFTGQKAILAGTRKSFDEVATGRTSCPDVDPSKLIEVLSSAESTGRENGGGCQ